MAAQNSYLTNELVITAMDRFVWFVLLVVLTHVATEMTRVSGYVRGSRNDVIMVNDTLNEQRAVHNLLLYPVQEYSPYDQQQKQQPDYQINMFYNRIQPNIPNTLTNGHYSAGQQPNSQFIVAPPSSQGSTNAQQIFPFSFRPIIDSIFEIPISTLRAVNNLVARLTGSYREAQSKSADPENSMNLAAISNSAMAFQSQTTADLMATAKSAAATAAKSSKRSLLREVSA